MELVGADKVVGHGTLRCLRVLAVQVVELLSIKQWLLLTEIKRPNGLLHALLLSLLNGRRRVTGLVARDRLLALVRLLLAVHLLLHLEHDLVVGVIRAFSARLEALLARTSLAVRLERATAASGRIPRGAGSASRRQVVALRRQSRLRVDDEVVVDLVAAARWSLRTLALVLLIRTIQVLIFLSFLLGDFVLRIGVLLREIFHLILKVLLLISMLMVKLLLHILLESAYRFVSLVVLVT